MTNSSFLDKFDFFFKKLGSNNNVVNIFYILIKLSFNFIKILKFDKILLLLVNTFLITFVTSLTTLIAWVKTKFNFILWLCFITVLITLLTNLFIFEIYKNYSLVLFFSKLVIYWSYWNVENYFWWLLIFFNEFSFFLTTSATNSLEFNCINIFVICGVLFFLTTFLSLFFLSYLGLYGVFTFNIISLSLFWISTFFVYNDIVQFNQFFKINFGYWFTLLYNFNINIEFYIDLLSITYVLLILTISVFVQFYTFSYFRFEPLTDRLILFLNLFIISMVFLVTSGNLVMLFLGWELIGLTSFVLINFWVTRKGTLKAAYKAFVFNKFSDACFFMFVILLFINFYEVDLTVLNAQAYLLNNQVFSFLYVDVSIIELVDLFILLTAFIKSAQFGGHLWLPDSMEAPVPASSLIHSATLVSAGLFLLLRFHVFFELSNYVYYIIPVIGALTGFYGGLCAMYQSDVKRILAYSTISHCGFLMVSFSTYLFDYTLFYLYVHGFFKAGVFLCVGNIIRFSTNYQDFRRMGGFYKYLPFECFLITVGLFNLSGIPFSLGFYMKHLFFTSLSSFYYLTIIIFILCLLGALTGLFYSFRLYYYVFFDFKKAKKNTYVKSNKINFISKYYSNTSLASNVAILGLFITSYLISFYCFFLIKTNYFTTSDYMSILNLQWINVTMVNDSFLWNTGYLNWLILINVIGLIFNFWRRVANNVQNYNFIIILFLFSINFFFCVTFLSI